ncbi:unnamed protein product, partial [Polarella glacialis]
AAAGVEQQGAETVQPVHEERQIEGPATTLSTKSLVTARSRKRTAALGETDAPARPTKVARRNTPQQRATGRKTGPACGAGAFGVSARAAAVSSTLRQRLAARGSPPPPPNKVAAAAPEQDPLTQMDWPPMPRSPPPSPRASLGRSPFGSPGARSSPPTGGRVATPCRSGQRRLSASQELSGRVDHGIAEEDLPAAHSYGLERNSFATPTPAQRQAPPTALRTPTPPPSQHSVSSPSSSHKDRKAETPPPSVSFESRLGGSAPQSGSAFSDLSSGKATSAAAPPQGVRELKALLAQQGVDCSGCVEKAELQQLWERFVQLRRRPLAELRAACAAAGWTGGVDLQSPADCARLLVSPRTQAQASPQSTSSHSPPRDGMGAAVEAAVGSVRCLRASEAARELVRILPLRREAFGSQTSWARAVLGLGSGRSSAALDVAGVQQAFRVLMRKLHPDRIGASEGAAQAMEMLREARQCCERALSQLQPPRAPRQLSSTTLCAAPGRRRIKLEWAAPEWCEGAPVRRYLVAALDPSYGRALTITVLEPNYSEELKRFVSEEELTSYILAEEELKKMPSLFRQANATVQVAAANEAGQSPWATMRVSLRDTTPEPAASSATSAASSGKSGISAAAGVAATARQIKEFESQAKTHVGGDLCSWLRRQPKGVLIGWLKSKSWPVVGSKDQLVDRVAYVMAGGGKA